MFKIFLSLLVGLMLCTTSCAFNCHEDEPVISNNIDSRSAIDLYEYDNSVDKEVIQEITGPYVSEDLKDLIEIFDNYSFYYQVDCNKPERVDDFTTWEIGKWTLENGILYLNYENGNKAFATFNSDAMLYNDGNDTKVFLKSGKVYINITKNPEFNN